ncbi:MAG TPA: hypothetical protein VFF70_11865, partial [Anaerolineae bacterium]|nr:hypothetical protein [Anaerolineae bacterium]
MTLNEQVQLTAALTVSGSGQQTRRMPIHAARLLALPLTFAVIILIWLLIIRLGNYPAFILPSPGDVWTELIRSIQTASFWGHIGVTLIEVLGGLVIGAALAIVLG